MTTLNRTSDRLEALASILDALDAGKRLADATAKRSEHQRLRLVMVHGAAALIIAPLFLVYSPPTG